MFRPTPFTKTDLARSIVARETATKVRYFDPETARMTGWLPKPPMLVAVRAMEAMRPKVIAAVVAIKAAAPTFDSALYENMPVTQLRKLASESGVKNASRMRKGDLIEALHAATLTAGLDA